MDLEKLREAAYSTFTEETDPRILFFFGWLEGELVMRKQYESFLKSVIIGKEPFDPEVHTFEWFRDKLRKLEE